MTNPDHDPFRSAGMTSHAAQFPRSPRQCAMFAAFIGVPVESLPETHRYFSNEHMKAAWERVESACLEFDGGEA